MTVTVVGVGEVVVLRVPGNPTDLWSDGPTVGSLTFIRVYRVVVDVRGNRPGLLTGVMGGGSDSRRRVR